MPSFRISSFLSLGALLLVSSVVLSDGQSTQFTVQASSASDWQPANKSSNGASISADGRFVVFTSFASNLVANDTNSAWDVFLKDLDTQQITRISESPTGQEGNFGSPFASISRNGRFVAFTTHANNLVPNYDGYFGVLVKDRTTGALVKVDTSSAGIAGNEHTPERPLVSDDGRYVVFVNSSASLVEGDTNQEADIFRKDLSTGIVERVNVSTEGQQAVGSGSWDASMSADGRYIAFTSDATGLVPGDTGRNSDVFVKDMVTGVLRRVSQKPDGTSLGRGSRSPSISEDGQSVAFVSDAANLVAGDTNGASDVFLYSLQTGEILRVSETAAGVGGDSASYSPSVSSDGQFVAFGSWSNNLDPLDPDSDSETFVKDMVTGEVRRVSGILDSLRFPHFTDNPSISGDGQRVAFLVESLDTFHQRIFVHGTGINYLNHFTTDLSVHLTSNEVRGGEPVVGTVTLARPAPATGARVWLLIRRFQTTATIPVSVTVPPGALSAEFPVTTRNTLADRHFIIRAGIGRRSATAPLTVLRSDGSQP